jgi:hypothetical protein
LAQMSAGLQDAARMAEEWRFSGWQEPDAITFVEQGFDWIRYDPECEWLASIEVLAEVSAGNRSGLAPVMLPYYWATQLSNDRDVIAQREVSAVVQVSVKFLLKRKLRFISARLF